MNKQWPVHTTDYYLALKKSELFAHAPIWMNLNIVMHGERSQIKWHILCDSIGMNIYKVCTNLQSCQQGSGLWWWGVGREGTEARGQFWGCGCIP